MKITDGIHKVLGIQKVESKSKVEKVSPVKGSKDNLSISNVGKDYQIAMKALKNIPDIREAKVQDIQARMQSGNYNISAEEVAEKLLSQFDSKI